MTPIPESKANRGLGSWVATWFLDKTFNITELNLNEEHIQLLLEVDYSNGHIEHVEVTEDIYQQKTMKACQKRTIEKVFAEYRS